MGLHREKIGPVMPRKSMTKADLAILANLVARYPLSEIARRVVNLSEKKKSGRPRYKPTVKVGNDAFLWALVDIQRDGKPRGAKKASEVISKYASKERGLKISSSSLAKAHRRIEKIRKANADDPAVQNSLQGIRESILKMEVLAVRCGGPPILPITKQENAH
jgi:hypothetical protein